MIPTRCWGGGLFMGKKLLLVDDDKNFVEIQKELFETYGFPVEVVYSGTEALRYLEHNKIDLIVSDVRMSDGDGMSLLESVRKSSEQPIVILMTGYSDLSEESVLNKGASALVTKPPDMDKLVIEINRLLNIDTRVAL
jgi:DNA-binding NtrC family response regulator